MEVGMEGLGIGGTESSGWMEGCGSEECRFWRLDMGGWREMRGEEQ